MKFLKAVVFITCLSLSVFLAKAAQAEETISIQHRVISSEPHESGSNVVMELTLTNNGISTLRDVKITAGSNTYYIFDPTTPPLIVNTLSVGEKLSVSWTFHSATAANYEQFVRFAHAILTMQIKAVCESGKTVELLVDSVNTSS